MKITARLHVRFSDGQSNGYFLKTAIPSATRCHKNPLKNDAVFYLIFIIVSSTTTTMPRNRVSDDVDYVPANLKSFLLINSKDKALRPWLLPLFNTI